MTYSNINNILIVQYPQDSLGQDRVGSESFFVCNYLLLNLSLTHRIDAHSSFFFRGGSGYISPNDDIML